MGIALVWFLAVGTGQLILLNYSNAPGLKPQAPSEWPTESQLKRSGNQPTLIMFVHPKCPCSRASAGELELIMAHAQGKVNAKVLFYRPGNLSDSWKETDLLKSVRRIPGVQVIEDLDGTEAKRFHIFTSGSTVLYDSKGHLLFSGGITPWRGHSGDNAGRSAINALLSGSFKTGRSETFVFGCPIFPQQKQGGNLS